LPLSPAADREMIHTRTMDLRAYRRSDGLYDIEGHIIDVKPQTQHLPVSHRAAGEPVHDMWLRLTVDKELVVRSAEAKLDVGGHAYCAGVEPNFAELAGLTIGQGWNRHVRERVGHELGCTHLVEMLAQMGTAAMQALWSDREHEREALHHPEKRRLPPAMLDSCFAFRRDSDFMRENFPLDYEAAE